MSMLVKNHTYALPCRIGVSAGKYMGEWHGKYIFSGSDFAVDAGKLNGALKLEELEDLIYIGEVKSESEFDFIFRSYLK